jgi:hypothetical protein
MNPLEHYLDLRAKTSPSHRSVQEAIDLKGASLDTNSKEAKLPYYSFCIFRSNGQYDRWRIWQTREGTITSDKDIAVPDLVAARKAAVIYLGEAALDTHEFVAVTLALSVDEI